MSTFSAKIRKNGFTVAALLSTRLARAFAHVLNMSIGKAIITYFPCAGRKVRIAPKLSYDFIRCAGIVTNLFVLLSDQHIKTKLLPEGLGIAIWLVYVSYRTL